MPRLQAFKLKDITTDLSGSFSVLVPENSVLKQMKIVFENIMAYYETENIFIHDSKVDNFKLRTDTFKILKLETEVPPNASFITILDTMIRVNNPEKQGEIQEKLIVLPIYKL